MLRCRRRGSFIAGGRRIENNNFRDRSVWHAQTFLVPPRIVYARGEPAPQCLCAVSKIIIFDTGFTVDAVDQWC